MQQKKLYRSFVNAVVIIIMLLLALFAYENLYVVPNKDQPEYLKDKKLLLAFEGHHFY